MPSYIPTLGKKAKRIKKALATDAGKRAIYGTKKPAKAALARSGGNPYGSLGPSPGRVAKVNAQILKRPPKPAPGTGTVRRIAQDPLTRLYNDYRSRILTDQQMQQRATEWVGGQLTPASAYVREEAARMRAAAAQRRDALSAAYAGAVAANQAMAPSILQGYTSAASTLGSLANAATGQVGAATRADIAAQNQALARVGQAPVDVPEGQQGVESYYGGYLPSANLAEMGAAAHTGHLAQVAQQRLEGVRRPWAEYEKEISELDANELSELSKLAQQRPELVGEVLETMRANNEKLLGGMLDVEKERYDRRVATAKLNQAAQTLRLKYNEAKRDARTAAEKAALDRWYKGEQVKLSSWRNTISQQNAQTSRARLGISQQQADTARIRAINAAKKDQMAAAGYEPLAEVIARAGRSRRDIPRGQSRTKIANALYQQYYLSVAPAQRAKLRAAINRWVATLPLQQKRGSSKPSFLVPTGG